MAGRLPSTPPVLPGLGYVRPLGSGGFADVFLYQQDMPRRAVAVKVLPADIRDPDLLRMFNAEADVLAHLSAHPSIVTVYQAGVSADGRPYIVMEYCPGSLSDRYRRERLSVAEVLAIGVRMASAIESAHHEGLVHRDVKPSNILITAFGAPVLADFGISSTLARQAADDVVAMSIPWSAPEVIAEESPGTVASEVWSLGATVYSLLAGRSPFERRERGENGRDQLRRRIAKASYTPIPRPDVPPSLQAVLAKAMARNPHERYPSARAFAEALREVQRETGLAETPLEVPMVGWAPASGPVDFADDTFRGPVRSRIERTTQRKSAARTVAGYARNEDADITGEAPRAPVWPWLVAGLGVLALVAAAVVVALVVAGVVG